MSAKKDYERAKKEHSEWEERLNAARTERNLLEEKLAAADQEFTSMENENSAVKREYLEWNRKEEELDRQKSVLNNKIAEIDSSIRAVTESIDAEQQPFRKKFIVLRGNGREMKCAEAWQWYESQKEKFQHPVFVPLLCTV
ncbi:unnamed protein product [Brugia timori]|uniref:Uncharacterized protein n=1 Tax=Brugia timori TaxID=42155 RepID=A0A3P7T704_9BILA|nr:unnamed protein product [Brugia timori]